VSKSGVLKIRFDAEVNRPGSNLPEQPQRIGRRVRSSGLQKESGFVNSWR